MRDRRHDWLYDVTARPIKEHVLEAVALRLAEAVERFPPTVTEWHDDAMRRRVEPLLSRGRPSDDVVRGAIRLFRWELAHDARAADAWLRTGHGLDDDGLATAAFLARWWLEEVLAFKEYAKGKFRWSELEALPGLVASRLLSRAG